MTRTRRPRLISLVILGVLTFGMLGGPAPVEGDSQTAASDTPQFEPGVILVAFNTGVEDASALTTAARDAVLRAYGAARVDTIPGIDVDIVSVAEGHELDVARALNRDPRVRYAEPNYLVHAHIVPNDTHYALQWAHPKINSPAAWDITTGSSAITVAVVDTGVELLDPEFQGRFVTGYDFANNDSDPNDDHGHGTHVAGIVAAAGNNSAGVAGMAWQTKIMPIKVLSSTGNGTHTATALGIRYAVDHGANIINMSLGGPSNSTTLYEAVQYAYDHGVLLVTSAGNCGDLYTYDDNGCSYQDQPVYPAAYDTEAFAVAATTSGDAAASFSNRGSYVDIAAPGYSILSTYLGNTFVYMNGTSQAAPHVAGLAALMLAFDPTLTAQELQTHMEVTSVDLGPTGPDIDYGAGRINALAAVESLLALEAPTLLAIDNDNYDGDYWVDWSDTLYATSYTLEEADNPTFISPIVRYTGATSTAFVTGRPHGIWYYRVRSERTSAEVSPWSSTTSTQVGLNTPVLQPIVNDGSSSYSVVWQAVTGATHYRLQESPDVAFATPTTLYEGANLSYPISGQTGGTWYYRVQAYNSTSDSLWTAIQGTTVLPTAPALAPIVLTPPDAYTLTWSTTAGATGYRLQEATDDAFTAPITRYLGISATYVVTGQPGGTWHYRVAAFNQAGFGPESNTRTVTVTASLVPTPLLHPIDYSNGTTHYTVSWTAVPTATYTLEESRSMYFEAPAIVYTGPFTSYGAMGQAPGPWHYRVRAHTTAGSSPWSNVRTVPAFVYLPLVVNDGAFR